MQDLIINENSIKDKIYTIRNMQVMLDRDLAELYGVETKRINEAVKNNQDKFMDDFYFELNDIEFEFLRSKISTTSFIKTRTNPKVFTEEGIYMLATILKSKVASQVTINLIKTFANMRKLISQNISLKTFKNSHDRFLIIDKKEIYHLGASLKDLVKKWFAFSKMSLDFLNLDEILRKLEL